MWQRPFKRKISWDLEVLGRVIRNKGRLMVLGPSEFDRRVMVICLTLITSKPRLSRLSEMSSAGEGAGLLF
jgi:ribosomal protein L36